MTSDDVLDLMGAEGRATEERHARRSRGGWLLPVRPGPGTELDTGDEPDEADDGDLQPVVKPRRLRDRTYRRRYGVAPFVQPSARRSRRKRRRDYRKLGFIELSQEKVRLRHRIFPRTVLGISAMILAFGIGAALSGATLYAYYDYRLSQNETSVETFASGFDDVFASAIGQLNGVRDQAVSSVNKPSARCRSCRTTPTRSSSCRPSSDPACGPCARPTRRDGRWWARPSWSAPTPPARCC